MGDSLPQSAEKSALPEGHPSLPGRSPSLPGGHPSVPSGSQKSASGSHGSMGLGHGGGVTKAAELAVIESLTKPEGYVSIAECYESRDELEGQSVRVLAVITKYSTNILGSNWVRLRDGTGAVGKDTLMHTGSVIGNMKYIL